MTSRRITRPSSHAAGFTLIEAIMVIVITGIVVGMVAVFIARPVQGYADSVRRAELTDAADVVLRRLSRDIRLALPNSLRVGTSGGINYIEFIMTSAGGRYRSAGDGSTAGNILSFTGSTTSFDVMGGLPANPAIAPGDFLVVYNLGEGYAPADAYGGGNRVQVDAAWGGANPVTLSMATRSVFSSQSPPLPSPSSRFQVVPEAVQAVTFTCPAAAPVGNFDRFAGYGFNATLADTIAALTGATPPIPTLMATNATCTVSYTPNASARNGLLSITLTLTDTTSNESVTLFREVHVDNSP